MHGSGRSAAAQMGSLQGMGCAWMGGMPPCRLASLVGLALAGLLPAAPARANCKAPEPAIVWSSPANGATGVGTDAHIFVLTSLWQHQPAQIVVNGVPVTRAALPFSYAPTLQPNTRYEVKVPGSTTQTEPQLSLSFTTGAGPVSGPAPAMPTVAGARREASRDFSPTCRQAWQAMDCFDTGQDTHLVFQTSDRPLLWIIEPLPSVPGETPDPLLWPGECEQPEVFIPGRVPAAFCRPLRLVAVSSSGQSSSVEVTCQEQPPTQTQTQAHPQPQPQGRSQGGCAVAGGGGRGDRAGLWLLLVGLIACPLRTAGRRRG